jgi:hypothetical protein
MPCENVIQQEVFRELTLWVVIRGCRVRRVMIFGPKDDGTYVVEVQDRRGRGAGDLDPAQRGARDPALSGADAVRVVRAASHRRNRTTPAALQRKGGGRRIGPAASFLSKA